MANLRTNQDEIPYPNRGPRSEIAALEAFACGIYHLKMLIRQDLKEATQVIPTLWISSFYHVGGQIYLANQTEDSLNVLDHRTDNLVKEFLFPGSVYERE